MVYTGDLKSLTSIGLRVRVPPPAQKQLRREHALGDYCFLPERNEKASAGNPFSRMGRASRAERSFAATEAKRALGRVPPPALQKFRICCRIRVIRLYIRLGGAVGGSKNTHLLHSSFPPIAQLVEHPTLNRQVVGSIPTGRTRRNKQRLRAVFSYWSGTQAMSQKLLRPCVVVRLTFL